MEVEIGSHLAKAPGRSAIPMGVLLPARRKNAGGVLAERPVVGGGGVLSVCSQLCPSPKCRGAKFNCHLMIALVPSAFYNCDMIRINDYNVSSDDARITCGSETRAPTKKMIVNWVLTSGGYQSPGVEASCTTIAPTLGRLLNAENKK